MRIVAAATIGALPFLPMCLAPTEVRIVLHTDSCSLRAAEIFIGGSVPVARKDLKADPACTNGRDIGDLVFVPSSRDSKFSFRVEGALEGGTCPSSKCIVARRQVGYVSHTPLTLPVELEAACTDHPCAEGLTCVKGQCVPDDVDCAAGSCTLPEAGVPDAAMPPCMVTDALALSRTKRARWSFDEMTGSQTKEEMGAATMLPADFVLGAPPVFPGCGTALTLGAIKTPLVFTVPMTTELVLGMSIRPGGTSVVPIVTVVLDSNDYYHLLLDPNGNNLNSQMCTPACGGGAGGGLTSMSRVDIELVRLGTGMSLKVFVDGNLSSNFGVQTLPATAQLGGGPIVLGDLGGTAPMRSSVVLDDLVVYAK
jgi:hypothetical protein